MEGSSKQKDFVGRCIWVSVIIFSCFFLSSSKIPWSCSF